MDLFLTQGFAHIGLQIFQNLDDQSLAQCVLVSSEWNVFITCQKFYWQRIVDKGRKSDLCQSQEWLEIMDEFNDMRQLGEILQEFFSYIKAHDYLLEDPEALHEFLYPYFVPVMQENLLHIDYLWPYLKHKGDVYCLAAEQGCVKVLEFIIEDIEDINPEAEDGVTLLHCVASNGHLEVLETIMNKIKVKKLKNPASEDGRTPLHFAASKGHNLVVEIIVNSITDNKNPATIQGCTPLHLAAEAGHYEIVRFILDKVYDKNPKDKEGRTPLHLAASRGHVEIVGLISRQIKDKNPRDKRGRTPLWYATESSQTDVIKCFHIS